MTYIDGCQFISGGEVLEPPPACQIEPRPDAEGDLLTVLSALGDPMRLRIVGLLAQREQCVCHLTATLGLSQGTVSHHMGVLKRAGLVRDRRDPDDTRWVYYSLDSRGVSDFESLLADFLDNTRTDPSPAVCRPRGFQGKPDSDGG